MRPKFLALFVLLLTILHAGCSGLVSEANKGAPAAPSVTTEPTSQTVSAGETATFSVVAAGSPPLTYQWNKNGAPVSGATSSSYTTPATTTADDGTQFAALVSNKLGSATSGPVSLHVRFRVAPSITTQPASQTVTAGQAATFTVVASGTAPLSYLWQKNGASITGATSASYVTPATTTADSGSAFDVIVTNSAGTATSNTATLTVNPATAAPSITTQPASQTVTAGQTATFSVIATGTAPLSYQWQKSGAPISGATSSSYTTPATTASDNGSQFTVVVSNSAGSLTSSAATLTVNAAALAPSITTQPASQTVTAGQTATFSVVATGTAPLSYQWQKSGAPISGATSSSYTTPATTASDSGSQFTVVVSNSAGSLTSSAATLTVNAAALAPSITTQPASQTVTAGQTATFSVVATGTAPLSYQWQKSGAPISGATSSSYTTPATTASDSGSQFTVVVSNSAGSVTSTSATLTVNVASNYQLNASPTNLSFGNVNTGSNSALSVTLTNSGNSSVTISGVTVSGAGFSDSGVSAGQLLSAGQTATLSVSFAPSAAGSVSGTVSVASNATNSPALITLSGTGVQQSAAFPVWVMPSLTRVGQADAPGSSSSISLSGARGETVDTQIVVQGPSGGLTNVNLSASALTGPNSATIPASEVVLYREYYLSVTGTASYGGGSNPPLGSGTYAEPLIPFNDPETGSALCSTSAVLKACNASVAAGHNQPYWIDISVPHGASNSPTGVYTGTISVTSDQGNTSIPVSLTVWNFELPVQPSELSLWTLWPANSGNTTASLAQALMRNKVMGWYDPASNAAADISNLGLNRSGLDNYYFIGIQCNGSYSSLPSTAQINSAAANFPAGLGLDFYLADELNGCTADESPIKTMGLNAHAANRSVKTMMTLNAPDANLFNEGDGRSAIDHWVLLDSVQQWPALPFSGGGSDLWSYTSCNAGFGNTPEWMVDYPPINERIQAGFLNWTQGATGLLYYRADGWTNGNTITSWNNVDTTACGGGLGRPGDGIFLYPPSPIASSESAPGIRLKAIRDGIQDYEYAHLLNSLGQTSFLNPIVVPIATSWTNWTHDPNALENARQQLGQQLHLLHP